MDNENRQPQILTPIINSLKVLFGLDDKQVSVLKGQATDTQKYGQTGTSFEERLSKLFVGSIELGQDRLSKYRDYDRMDASSTECGVALDIYGEEASQKDSKTGLRVWIDSPEEEVAQVLNAMIQRIKLENKVYGIYRNLAKYGDVFLYLSLGGYGIHDSQFIHPARVERYQTNTLLGFKCPDLAGLLPTDNKGQLFKPWEFCVDSTTEILTEKRGWVLFKDLLTEDKVATRNQSTKELEWQRPTHYVNSPYIGDMYRIKSTSVDLVVTPNHRMLVTKGNNKEEVFITAKEIAEANKYQSYYKIPMSSDWSGSEIQEKIFTTEYKGVGKYPKPLHMSGDDYVAFMGMYLSEGHTSGRKGITIGQYSNSKGYQPYKELLEKIFGKEIKHNGKSFSFHSDALASFLQGFGLSENKYVPFDILNSSKRQLQIFWEYYLLGDGSLFKRTTKTKRTIGQRNGVYTSVHTTSKVLAGHIQEIVQKLGLSASMWTRAAYTKTRKIDGRKFECKESYVIAVRHKLAMSFKITKEFYNGTTHCVTVPNGTIYVRRNGKPTWTGNCHFRIMAYDQESTSGRSFLENVRKAWKSFSMLETMLVLYRISKTVQRNVFYVDVGQASVEETHILVADYKKYLKTKNYFTDPKTNEFKVDFDPAMFLQDIVWPIRTGSASRVEPLQNNPNIGSLEDYEQLKDKIRTGLNIPKDYFDGVTTGTWNSKEALQLQDVRFSKKIQKLQDALREGVIRMCQIHWGIIKGEFLDPQRFQVQLGTISEVAERQREDVLLRKAQIVEILSGVAVTLGWNRWAWGDYILDEIFPLPAEVRAKLMTPDPVLGMEFEKEQKLAKADGGDKGKIKGGKGIKLNKPNRQVTADSLKFGLRGFGYGEAKEDLLDPTKDLTEEFKEVKELEQPTLKPGELVENSMWGYRENELQKLLFVRPLYKEQEDNSSKVREILEGLGAESAEYYLTESEEFFKHNYASEDILEVTKKDIELG